MAATGEEWAPSFICRAQERVGLSSSASAGIWETLDLTRTYNHREKKDHTSLNFCFNPLFFLARCL